MLVIIFTIKKRKKRLIKNSRIEFMKKTGKILENLIVFIAVAVVMFLLATMLLPKFGYGLIVIKSGSMEPTIKTGSITVIKKQADYEKGDIITFVKTGREMVTHRITQVMETESEVAYKTKGDNNNAEDMFLAQKGKVIGKTMFAIPYFGYVIGFLKSKIGVVVLILIPSGYFIGREILKIKKELKKRKEDKI